MLPVVGTGSYLSACCVNIEKDMKFINTNTTHLGERTGGLTKDLRASFTISCMR